VDIAQPKAHQLPRSFAFVEVAFADAKVTRTGCRGGTWAASLASRPPPPLARPLYRTPRPPRPSQAMGKCLTLYNNSKWRGRVLHVAKARPSSLSKVLAECASDQAGPAGGGAAAPAANRGGRGSVGPSSLRAAMAERGVPVEPFLGWSEGDSDGAADEPDERAGVESGRRGVQGAGLPNWDVAELMERIRRREREAREVEVVPAAGKPHRPTLAWEPPSEEEELPVVALDGWGGAAAGGRPWSDREGATASEQGESDGASEEEESDGESGDGGHDAWLAALGVADVFDDGADVGDGAKEVARPAPPVRNAVPAPRGARGSAATSPQPRPHRAGGLPVRKGGPAPGQGTGEAVQGRTESPRKREASGTPAPSRAPTLGPRREAVAAAPSRPRPGPPSVEVPAAQGRRPPQAERTAPAAAGKAVPVTRKATPARDPAAPSPTAPREPKKAEARVTRKGNQPKAAKKAEPKGNEMMSALASFFADDKADRAAEFKRWELPAVSAQHAARVGTPQVPLGAPQS